MIQRIQTVWLILAMACAVLLLYFPVWQIFDGGIEGGMEEVGAGKHFFLLPFAPILFIFHSLAIYSFKNRKRQLNFCNIDILLFVIYMIAALAILQTENQIFSDFHLGDFKFGALLPIIGIILNLMAKSGIKKDEELVRSMDRLR